jgi:hypothetical protein
MAGSLPPIIVAITASAAGLKAGLGEAKGEIKAFGDSTQASMTAASAVGKVALTGLVVGAIAVGGASVKMAGDFQESVTQLQTGAGESAANLGLVSKGMVDMAGSVGTSAQALSSGMYLVESAGYHGADGLTVLKAAAEGAKLGNADLKTVADGVTTALTDYQLPADQAAVVTSKLVTAVAAGKTTMEALSSSLSTVLPAASKAGIGMDEVLGAMSTMTAQGISAQQASQNLAGTIGALQNPSAVASKAMAQMGLNSTEVAQNLGKKGLTGTMEEMATAVMAHMGPAGLVLQSSFNESKLAAQSAKTELAAMPASLQKIAQGYLDGTVTQKQWMAELKTQPALTANLGRQFATTAKAANGFSDTLKAGKGDAQTFNAVMGNMTGGQSGLASSLALTGGNMETFKGNVADIAGASADASGNVKDWGEVQKDFNFKIASAASALNSVAINIGTALIPKIEALMDGTAKTVTWFTKHQSAAIALGAVVGGVLATAIGIYTVKVIASGVQSTISAAKTVAGWVASGAAAVASAAAGVFAFGQMVAGWIASGAQASVNAAKVVAGWVATGVAAVVSGAQSVASWVASGAATAAGVAVTVAQLAVQGAKWVWSGIVATASAVQIAAAWVISMGPIAIVIAAVIGLGVLIATHMDLIKGWISSAWNWIKDVTSTVWNAVAGFFTGIWDGITSGVSTAINWVKAHWPLILGILTGPIGLAVLEIATHWDTIVGFVQSVPGRIASAASGMWDGIKNSFKGVVNWIISGWNSIHLTLPSIDTHIPGIGVIGGFNLQVPQMPMLANGTDNFAGGSAVVGENGRELVNLPKGSQVVPHAQTESLLNGAGGKGSGNVYIQDYHAGTQPPEQIAADFAFRLRTVQ